MGLGGLCGEESFIYAIKDSLSERPFSAFGDGYPPKWKVTLPICDDIAIRVGGHTPVLGLACRPPNLSIAFE